jgi:hypothetical protein
VSVNEPADRTLSDSPLSVGMQQPMIATSSSRKSTVVPALQSAAHERLGSPLLGREVRPTRGRSHRLRERLRVRALETAHLIWRLRHCAR